MISFSVVWNQLRNHDPVVTARLLKGNRSDLVERIRTWMRKFVDELERAE